MFTDGVRSENAPCGWVMSWALLTVELETAFGTQCKGVQSLFSELGHGAGELRLRPRLTIRGFR